MATIAVYPSILGARRGIFDFADRLRSEGHDVRIVDYADGMVFDDYESAMAEADKHDWNTVMEHALTLTKADLPTGLVVAGFSKGTAIAEKVALAMDARAAVLVGGASAMHYFDGATWPQSCPVQVHRKAEDEFLTEEEAQEGIGSLRGGGADVEDFVYDGRGHLFNDQELTDEYDAAATDLMISRIVELLERVD